MKHPNCEWEFAARIVKNVPAPHEKFLDLFLFLLIVFEDLGIIQADLIK